MNHSPFKQSMPNMKLISMLHYFPASRIRLDCYCGCLIDLMISFYLFYPPDKKKPSKYLTKFNIKRNVDIAHRRPHYMAQQRVWLPRRAKIGQRGLPLVLHSLLFL